jgi:hypothetical protein
MGAAQTMAGRRTSKVVPDESLLTLIRPPDLVMMLCTV